MGVVGCSAGVLFCSEFVSDVVFGVVLDLSLSSESSFSIVLFLFCNFFGTLRPFSHYIGIGPF